MEAEPLHQVVYIFFQSQFELSPIGVLIIISFTDVTLQSSLENEESKIRRNTQGSSMHDPIHCE